MTQDAANQRLVNKAENHRVVNYALARAERAGAGSLYSSKTSPRRRLSGLLARIRYQLIGGFLLSVLLPALIRTGFDLRPGFDSLQITMVGTTVAMFAGVYALRRLLAYPGVQGVSFVLPSFAAVYALAALGFLFLRLDYSRFQLIAGFVVSVPWFTLTTIVEKRYKRPLLGVLPFGNAETLTRLAGADWWLLKQPDRLPAGMSGVVADLRSDLPPEWERMLANAALRGLPVYHSKQVIESISGRVEIEHLSENSLGSLIPSSIYLRFKRVVDVVGVVLALPLILPVAMIAALMVKLEDGGPVFFRQPRMGHRGRVFSILKFRTMRTGSHEGGHFTEGDDPRITRVGRVLRRYRIDELPQVLNILRGEMSWIGPRPESLPLSQQYERQIPFYSYRHIVRPGISGWAQVQQGYAAQLEAVTGKLHYDFFYIKHFSPWLDLLIVARTIRTVLTGFGAR
jgi:lipopolysaccharide/colanic/teichoic acid biosynthesis glycosyltransferase